MYNIIISDDADADLENLFYAITEDYKAPETAFRYLQGLKDTIKKLELYAGVLPVNFNRSLQKYGTEVRTLVYKKMTIIYTVNDNAVYVHRVIAGSLIV